MFTACHNQSSLLTMFKATKGSREASTYDQVIFQQLASRVTLWLHRWSMTDQTYGKTSNTVNYCGKLTTSDYNRLLPSSKNTHFQNEARCTTFLVKMSFICMRRKNDFHIKGWAPILVLKQRFGGYAGVRVEMIVEVHCGTVLEDAFSIWRQIRPPKKSHNALWQPFRPGFSRNLKVANKSYLSHSGEESLGIEEACHPEHIRSSFKTPIPKLTVSFQKFGVPESKRGRLPWDLKSDEIKWKKNGKKWSMSSRESTFKCVTRPL